VGLGRNFLYLLAERIDEDGAGAAGAGRTPQMSSRWRGLRARGGNTRGGAPAEMGGGGGGGGGGGWQPGGGGEGRLGQAGAWCSPMDAQVTCL
jgi:hypothetical protein